MILKFVIVELEHEIIWTLVQSSAHPNSAYAIESPVTIKEKKLIILVSDQK